MCTRTGNPIAVVLDNSAAMQAHGGARARSRFDIARAALTDALRARRPGRGQPFISPPRSRIAPVRHSRALPKRRRRSRELHPADAPSDQTALTDALERARLRHAPSPGDLCRRTAARSAGARRGSQAITAGDPLPNYAIGSFALRRESLATGRTARPPDGRQLQPGGADAAARDHRRRQVGRSCPGAIGARRRSARSSFPTSRRPASIAPSSRPPTASRSTTSPTPPPARSNRCRSCSSARRPPTPPASIGLRRSRSASRRPRAYSPNDLATVDLAIFEYAMPKEMPPVNTLLVMPPPADPVFGFTVQPTAKVEITGWPPTDPLTDSVNFRLLNLRGGEYFGQHPWMPGDGHRQRRRADARGRAPGPSLSSPWASIRFPISAGKTCRCRC